MAFMRCRGHHVAHPRSRRGPAPARTRSPLHFPLSPSPRAAPCPQLLRHCRPCVAVVVHARHYENELPSPSVASSWSSLPSPPHRRVNRASVRAFSPFSPSPPSRDLAGAGVPRGQLPPWSFLIFLPLVLASVCDTEARRAGH